MERGLYGQAESDGNKVNAEVQRFADVEGEGVRTSDGNLTEQGYRLAMGAQAAREVAAAKGERKAEAAKAPELIKGVEVRGWVQEQQGALQAQADLAEGMREDGFAQGNIYAALTLANPIAYHQQAAKSQANSKGFQGAPDRRDNTIKGMRRLPKMYTLERDSLVGAEGKPRMNGAGVEIKI